jgi:Beta-galactosidase
MMITRSAISRQIRSVKRAASLTALLCAGLLALPSSAFSQSPRGVYSIPSTGKKIQDPILANPNVDGISLRQNWTDIEKTEGVYDWSYFDGEITRVAAVGKKVLLRVMTMAGRPAWVTNAVTAAGGKFFKWNNNGVNSSIPVFWDPTFLAKKKALIAAMGAHYTNNPTVAIVCTSFANAVTEDWNVPHTPALVPQWLRLGYTTANMLSAGQQIIDATMAAFPNDWVTLAVAGTGNSGLDQEDDTVARGAVDAARASWPGRLIVQKNDLSTCIPAAPGTGFLYGMIWDYQPDVAGQMVTAAYNDPTYKISCGVPLDITVALETAVGLAITYGEKRVEIYEGDVVRYPLAIAYAHAALLAEP